MGWLGLRREAKIHSPHFWVRPMLVEIAVGAMFAALYWREVGQLGLLIPPLGTVDEPSNPVLWAIHAQYAAHLLLACLMLVASLIDFDVWEIPDSVTVPGTLLGLLLAAIVPWSMLPVVQAVPAGTAPQHDVPTMEVERYERANVRRSAKLIKINKAVKPLHIATPDDWPQALGPAPRFRSLVLGLACFWAACVALLPWRPERGVWIAMRLMFRRRRYPVFRWRPSRGRVVAAMLLVRHWQRKGIVMLPLVPLMMIIGGVAIAAVWSWGDIHWAGLLTAIIGMSVSGGIVWAVRIIGQWTMKREAMGFGDVTLMAMIGAFVGWQPSLMIFFMAPFAGVVLGLVRWIVRSDDHIPYGPFLCLATAVLIVGWAAVWNWAGGPPEGSPGVFAIDAWLVPAAVVVCLVLMAGMLFVMQIVKGLFSRGS
jgi:prepilin signal peptidase PulO-like enzyme (type II secretory pathway)